MPNNIVFAMTEPDGLSLEYKRDYGTAIGDLNVADLVNNPAANGECRVLGLSLQKQGADLLGSELSSLLKDGTDPFLIGHNRA